MSISIKKLLQSDSDEKEQLVDGYSIKGVVNSENFDTLIDLVESYLDNNLIKKTSTIKLDTSDPYRLYNISDIKQEDLATEPI